MFPANIAAILLRLHTSVCLLIKYTGGDFVFVPVCTPLPPAADPFSRDNFWTTFWISFIFGTIVGPDM